MPHEKQLTFQSFNRACALQAEIAKCVEELATISPDTARALVTGLCQLMGVSAGAKQSEAKTTAPAADSGFAKVVNALVEAKNKAMTKTELAAAAGVRETSLHSILYGDRASLFERAEVPGNTKLRYTALKKDVYEEEVRKRA